MEGPRVFCLGNLVVFLLVEDYEKTIERHIDYRRHPKVLFVPTIVEYVTLSAVMLAESPRVPQGVLELFPTYKKEGEVGSPKALGEALRAVIRDHPDDLIGIVVNPHEVIALLGLIWEFEPPDPSKVADKPPEEVAELIEAEEDGGRGVRHSKPRRRPRRPQPPSAKKSPRKGRKQSGDNT